MEHKPHLQRKSDFVRNNPIAEHNNAGILVTRQGNRYRFAIELDIDSVVEVAETENQHHVPDIINSLIPKVPAYRERFSDCFPD